MNETSNAGEVVSQQTTQPCSAEGVSGVNSGSGSVSDRCPVCGGSATVYLMDSGRRCNSCNLNFTVEKPGIESVPGPFPEVCVITLQNLSDMGIANVTSNRGITTDEALILREWCDQRVNSNPAIASYFGNDGKKRQFDDCGVVAFEPLPVNLPRSDRQKELRSFILTCVGEASMCWNPRPSSEVFASEEAQKVADKLVWYVGDYVKSLQDESDQYFEELKRVREQLTSVLRRLEEANARIEREVERGEEHCRQYLEMRDKRRYAEVAIKRAVEILEGIHTSHEAVSMIELAIEVLNPSVKIWAAECEAALSRLEESEKLRDEANKRIQSAHTLLSRVPVTSLRENAFHLSCDYIEAALRELQPVIPSADPQELNPSGIQTLAANQKDLTPEQAAVMDRALKDEVKPAEGRTVDIVSIGAFYDIALDSKTQEILAWIRNETFLDEQAVVMMLEDLRRQKGVPVYPLGSIGEELTRQGIPVENATQPLNENGPAYDMSIHSNPDARAWAKFFVETVEKLAKEQAGGDPDVSTDLLIGMVVTDKEYMHGWFANAMMAMHDHLKRQQPAGIDKDCKEWRDAMAEIGGLKGEIDRLKIDNRQLDQLLEETKGQLLLMQADRNSILAELEKQRTIAKHHFATVQRLEAEKKKPGFWARLFSGSTEGDTCSM